MTRRRVWRYGLLGVAGIILLAAIAIGVEIARFDPNSLKPRIVAAVEQATGRKLALNGPIGLKVSLWPTVELQNVALANPPGFSRPDTATLQRLDLQLAILPLLRHRVVIDRLVLVKPDIALETNAQGATNWQFAPAGKTPPKPSHGANGGSTPMAISVHDVLIQDGTVVWRDDRTHKLLTLGLPSLSAHAAGPDAPTTLAVKAAYNGMPVTLNGEIGSLARLQQPDATTPWPVKLTLAAAGATVSVDGSLTHPMQGRGYALTVTGAVPDLTKLAPLLPGVTLPPLHGVTFDTRIADSGKTVPRIESATVHLGPANLDAYVSGLQIASADLTAPPNNQPVTINVQASRDATLLSLVATMGAPGTPLQALSAPVPVDLTLRAGNASLNARGSIAHPETLSGADLALAASIPDLGALAGIARRPLPAVKNIAFKGTLIDGPGGLQHGATLKDMVLTTADGDLSGTVTVAAGPPRMLDGTLHANRIDADALLAAIGKPEAVPPAQGGAPPPANPGPAAPGTAGSAPAARPAPPPHPATTRHAASNRLFSTTPLPFGLLRQANANLALTVGDLKSGGLDYRNIVVHLLLRNGQLRIAPFDATLPEGRLAATLSADANAPAPPVALTIHAPGLEVAPLLAAAGMPGYASGRLEIYADLHGAGASPHAIAAGLDGTLGLAMAGGTIDTRLLNALLGPVLERANLLQLLGGGGSSALRCFALRADMQHGIATLRTLLLNSALLTMDGGGSVNLGQETLALQLRPQGRIAGTGLVVPLTVTGPIRSPGVQVNAIGAAKADVGTVAGAVVGSATPLGLVAGLLGGGKILNTTSVESCPAALAVARGQAPPPAPAPSRGPAPAARSRPQPANPADLLKNLFR